MSEILQWIIVAVVVAAAARYLFLRLKKKGSGCACDGNCSACNIDPDRLTECKDKSRQD